MSKILPHQFLFDCAINEGKEFLDVLVTKDGDVVEFQRPLTLKERLECAKAAAPFFAPTLKSVEAKAVIDTSALSTEELEIMANKLLAREIQKESRH